MNYDVILIRYGELALKSTYVRRLFESVLVRNIKAALNKDGIANEIQTERGRIYLISGDIPKTIEVLSRIFGIVSFSPAVQTSSTLQDISRTAQQVIKNSLTRQKSFAIRVTRAGNHPYTSQDVAVHIGNDIVNATHAKVNLTKPDRELFIEIRDETSFIFTEKIHGVRGLPLGTQGRVLALVEEPSSLLAAWYLMSRGCNVVILTTQQVNEQAIRAFLSYWYADVDIVSINPTKADFYNQLNTVVSETKCDALVTGYTLEKTTQTLSNIRQLKRTISLPVLCPLIALTKQDIAVQCNKRGISV